MDEAIGEIGTPQTPDERSLTCALLAIMRVDPSVWPKGKNPTAAIVSAIGDAVEILGKMSDRGVKFDMGQLSDEACRNIHKLKKLLNEPKAHSDKRSA